MPTNPSQPLVLVSKENLDSYTNELQKLYLNENFSTITDSNPFNIVNVTKTISSDFPKNTNCFISKIQGQTRRYSENLIHLKDIESTTVNGITYSIENGTITLNGTSTQNVFIYILEEDECPYPFSFSLNNSEEIKTCTFLFLNNNIPAVYTNTNIPANYFYSNDNKGFQLIFRVDTGAVLNNVKIKPMLVKGTYTSDTMPSFQPFNNKLVHSNSILKVTGRNFVDMSKFTFATHNCRITRDGNVLTMLTSGSDSYCITNESIFLYPGKYKFVTTSNYKFQIGVYVNESYIGSVPDYPIGTCSYSFTLNSPSYIKLRWDGQSDSDFWRQTFSDIYLSYDSSDISFEEYTETDLDFGIILGEYDFIDTFSNKVYRKTSSIYTIDGSPDENWELTPGAGDNSSGWRFLLSYFIKELAPDQEYNQIINKSNWIDETAGATYGTPNSLGIAVQGYDIFIANPHLATVDDLRTFLKKYPISFCYKTVDTKIEDCNVQKFYPSALYGLEIQEAKENSTLYVLEKQYAISLKSSNINNSYLSEEMQNIYSLNRGLKGNNNFTSKTINDIFDITGKDLDVEIADKSSCIITKLSGQTITKSKNLYKPKYNQGPAQNCIETFSNDDKFLSIQKNTSTIECYSNTSGIFLKAGTYTFGGICPPQGYLQIINSENTSSISDRILYNNYNFSCSTFSLSSDQTVYIRAGLTVLNDTTNIFRYLFIYEGSYNEDNLPSYQKYDNTLVNSCSNIYSVGKNLFDVDDFIKYGIDSASKVTKINSSEFIWTDSGNRRPYQLEYYLNDLFAKYGTYTICFYDDNSNTKIFNYFENASGEVYTNQKITISKAITNIQMSNSGFSNLTVKVMINLGKEALPYEPFQKNILPINKELGMYDYIDFDTQLLYKRTSKIFILDGSDDENYDTSVPLTNTKRFRFYLPKKVSSNKIFVDNSTLEHYNNSSLYSNDSLSIGLDDNTDGSIWIRQNVNWSIDEFKSWLQKNPISFVYELSEPIVENISIPNVLVVNKDCLEIQDNVPYIIDKKYPYNIKTEINNVEVLPNIDIKKSFSDFLNTVELKYPKSMYDKILEEVT